MNYLSLFHQGLMPWAVLLTSGLLSGCISEAKPHPYRGAFMGVLALNDDRSIQHLSQQKPLSTQISIEPGKEGTEPLITLCVEETAREALLSYLLLGSQVSYLMDHVEPSGVISLCLHRAPLSTVLQAILAPVEADAVWVEEPSGRVLHICNRDDRVWAPAAAPPASPPSAIVKTYDFQHLLAADLQSRLFVGTGSQPGIFPANSGSVQVGVDPAQNTLLFRGPADAVQRCLRMGRLADRPPPKIRVEVMEFIKRPELDSVSLIPNNVAGLDNDLFMGWSPFSRPPVNKTILPGGLLIHAAQGLHPPKGGLPYGLNYTALHTSSFSDLISRSILLVSSGQKVSMQSGKNGYILVPQFSAGIPIGQTQEIQTGVIYDITPTALPTGQIRVTLNCNNSLFTENAFVKANTSTTTSQTVVQILNDGWIVASGLYLANSTTNIQGAPTWIRKLPIIGPFVSALVYTPQTTQTLLLMKFSTEQGEYPLDGGFHLDQIYNIPVSDLPAGIDNLGESRAALAPGIRL